eukprot:112431-Hanusia_phi.AAC.1
MKLAKLNSQTFKPQTVRASRLQTSPPGGAGAAPGRRPGGSPSARALLTSRLRSEGFTECAAAASAEGLQHLSFKPGLSSP